MDRERILSLKPEDVNRLLTAEEIVHIAKALGAFWSYDHEALKGGKPGLHALLKSGLHSDGFFVSRILLSAENIRKIISEQMAMRIFELKEDVLPDYVAGVPNGANELGLELAELLGAEHARMEKVGGKIKLVSHINPGDSILLVEDFCTRGTGFAEAVSAVKETCPEADIFKYDPVIINRGGLKVVSTEFGDFKILSVVDVRIQDWDPDSCELCRAGSVAIKPKESDQNWHELIESQR